MSISDITTPIREQPRAYLQGQFVGYGELSIVTQWAEVTNWDTPTIVDIVPVGVRLEGTIAALPESADLVYELAATQAIVDFGEEGNTVKVRIAAVEYGLGTTVYAVAVSELEGVRAEVTARTLCDRCQYLVPYPFNACNALHPTIGVSDCVDFRKR